MSAELTGLTAGEIVRRLADGLATAEAVTRAHLDRIAAADSRVQAWAFLDPDHAIAQARGLDAWRASGRPTGPLHGVPVGLKDIVDTRDMPTENGTVLDAGRRPRADAAVAERLRGAGAVIVGKTVTTELAVFTPGKTRNPHDPARTPGGSSSGSAAAVAAGMVPLAIGSQTNGSVIRPASYCGVVGYKPSRGLVSRHGMLAQSRTLDTVGVFAHDIADAALLVDVLAGYDARDPGLRRPAGPALLAQAQAEPPLPPRLAFVATPVWDEAEEDVRTAFAELADVLGQRLLTVELPALFGQAHQWHRRINLAEMAWHYARYMERGEAALSARLCAMIADGRGVTAVDYLEAQAGIERLAAALDPVFDAYDAIVTPAAAGEAPLGLESTGSPRFCTIWTACGTPAVSLPLMKGRNGLPIGVQLVGRFGEDGRLLRTARWLTGALAAAA